MENLARAYKALSDPTRLGILALLMRHEELCVCELEVVLGITQSKTSRHLSHLANAGLVKGHRRGQWMHYSVLEDADGPRPVILRQLRQLFDKEQLEELDQRLEMWRTSRTVPVPVDSLRVRAPSRRRG